MMDYDKYEELLAEAEDFLQIANLPWHKAQRLVHQLVQAVREIKKERDELGMARKSGST